MYLSINDTELYFDVEGAQLRVENNRLCTRPTIVVLLGGPGFDQAYLRPDLSGLADLGAAAFERLVAPHYAGPGHEDVPARLFPLSPLTAEIARQFFAELAPSYDLRPRLGEITVPALVVAGEHDWVCPPSAARALAAGLPRATLCVVPDAGHFTFAEQPGRFRAALAELLTGARPVE